MRIRSLSPSRTRLDSEAIAFAALTFRVILGVICLIYLSILGTQYFDYRKVPQPLLDAVPHCDDFLRGIRFIFGGVCSVVHAQLDSKSIPSGILSTGKLGCGLSDLGRDRFDTYDGIAHRGPQIGLIVV